jgi:hypothetical protein
MGGPQLRLSRAKVGQVSAHSIRGSPQSLSDRLTHVHIPKFLITSRVSYHKQEGGNRFDQPIIFFSYDEIERLSQSDPGGPLWTDAP